MKLTQLIQEHQRTAVRDAQGAAAELPIQIYDACPRVVKLSL